MVTTDMRCAPATIRVLIADNRRFFAAGLTRLLSDDPAIHVAVEAADAPATLIGLNNTLPDVALISYGLADDIVGLLHQVRAVAPDTAVILYGAPHAGDSVLEALRVGVKGLIDQEANLNDLIAAVESVAVGRIVISPHLAAQVAVADGAGRERWSASTADAPPLSLREVEILQLVAEGASNRDVAVALGLSPHTIRAHLRAVMRKLNVQSRVHAVALGIQLGLLSPSVTAPVDGRRQRSA